MAEVKILIEGVHEALSENIVRVECTTTLIKSDKNIVVDPGAFVNRNKLVDALKKENLSPDDIKIVFLTHLHLDHIANIHLFPKAKIYLKFISGKYPGQIQEIGKGLLQRVDILNENVAEDLRIIDTAGHSIDQISLIVDTADGVVVVSGDAIPGGEWANADKKPNPDFIYDVEKFEESRKKILKLADYIIPGHGPMFKVEK